MKIVSRVLDALVLGAMMAGLPMAAQAGERPAAAMHGVVELKVRPSSVDPGISAFDAPHRVLYDPQRNDGNLLVFLVGTTERPGPGPRTFLRTALAQGSA